MSNNENLNKKIEHEVNNPAEEHEEMNLDDARRVKVLSPNMLVFRRFIRNKLAVVGLAILFFMFTFAFIGPMFSPYTQTEVFKGMDSQSKEFAGATFNQELRYTIAEGESFSDAERAQFLFAMGKDESTFESGDYTYTYVQEGEGIYRILKLEPVAEYMLKIFTPVNEDAVPKGLEMAFQDALKNKEDIFEFNGTTYRITKDKKVQRISVEQNIAIALLPVYDAYHEADIETVSSFDFKLASSLALSNEEEIFILGTDSYTIEYNETQATILNNDGKSIAQVSEIIVNPIDQNIFLSVEFKSIVREAVTNRSDRFTFAEEGDEPIEYTIDLVNNTYNILKDTPIEIIRIYENPSIEHPLGLDNNGMDLMTRLMHGGQVSLLVGFVVIFIEGFIGIIIGGISGYFGGAIDTGLMRFVDLFNSIPFYPMVLIFGSVMDTLEVEPMARIFLLMFILGLLGWTGIARVVRGQILTLREQDFMLATEATGIRTSRRIFRHLIPNIMPLLIVQATAGLGGIIIAEATLGFLGLGVKYPLASWGSIINTASDAYVMTNFWFMWIPAGLLILLTVLGFNFVGDGLRDAYDPKMKR